MSIPGPSEIRRRIVALDAVSTQAEGCTLHAPEAARVDRSDAAKQAASVAYDLRVVLAQLVLMVPPATLADVAAQGLTALEELDRLTGEELPDYDARVCADNIKRALVGAVLVAAREGGVAIADLQDGAEIFEMTRKQAFPAEVCA